AFWDVLAGASVLQAGESGTFTLHTDDSPEVFNVSAGAQVIVNDANSYGLRASTFLPAAPLAYPDRIPNGDYVYWNATNSAPYAWGFVGNPQNGLLRLHTQTPSATEPERVLQMQLTPTPGQTNELAVDTWLMLPDAPLTLWVNPPVSANQAPDFKTLYGIQIVLTANAKRFYILFGAQATSGTLPSGDIYTMIAAPAGSWSQQTIRLPEIIQALDIPLPDPEIRRIGSLQIPMHMANFRLYVRSNEPLLAEFGPIQSQPNTVTVQDALIDQTIQSPADLLLWRGDINLLAGNSETAHQYYQQALDANPKSGAANYRLATTLVALGQYAEAQMAVQAALDNGYRSTARAYWTLGNVYLGLKQFPEAQTAFATALDRLTSDLAPYNNSFQAEIYSGLGQALILQNRPEVAEGMFARASQLNPFDLANYQALFSIYAAQTRCTAAALLENQAARYELPVTALENCPAS
ncbi:MAG: tetratricopeptide repeat protein, partial [Chloroflexota bacterium]